MEEEDPRPFLEKNFVEKKTLKYLLEKGLRKPRTRLRSGGGR